MRILHIFRDKEKKVNKLHKILKAKRQAKYLKKLEEQKTPLTAKQFRRLAKFDLPPEKPFHEFMLEWGVKSHQRQESEDKMVANFLTLMAEKIVQDSTLEENRANNANCNTIVFSAPVNVEHRITKPIWKKSSFRWLASTAAVCMLCLAVALPLVFCGGIPGSGYSGEEIPIDSGRNNVKTYTALNAKVLSSADGIYFSDIYAIMLDTMQCDGSMLVFTAIIPGPDANKEIYNDETEELLSYVLNGMIVDASAGMELVVFTVDYRIRFVPQYKFNEYEAYYEELTDGFAIGEVEIRYEIKTTMIGECEEVTRAFLNFTFGDYDYFLEIKVFEMEGFGVVTELSKENLILLMQNLYGNR